MDQKFVQNCAALVPSHCYRPAEVPKIFPSDCQHGKILQVEGPNAILKRNVVHVQKANKIECQLIIVLLRTH